MSADGKIDSVARAGARLSNREDLNRVDALRAAFDAVAVGGATLRGDDPGLCVRSSALRSARAAEGRRPQPWRIGIVSEVDLEPTCHFVTVDPSSALLLTSQRSHPAHIARLERAGVTVLVSGRDRVDLPGALKQLRMRGIESLLVEGGGTLNAALLGQGLVDEISLFLAPRLLGGVSAPTPVDGAGLVRRGGIVLEHCGLEILGDGVVLRYRVQHERALASAS